MAEDLAALKARLADRLPDHAAAALAGYEDFTAAPPPTDSKGFAAWHAAAKAALAHMDLLVKLARWADGTAETGDGDGMDRLLAGARAALDALDDPDDPDGEE
jgi:hypothetical protein